MPCSRRSRSVGTTCGGRPHWHRACKTKHMSRSSRHETEKPVSLSYLLALGLNQDGPIGTVRACLIGGDSLSASGTLEPLGHGQLEVSRLLIEARVGHGFVFSHAMWTEEAWDLPSLLGLVKQHLSITAAIEGSVRSHCRSYSHAGHDQLLTSWRWQSSLSTRFCSIEATTGVDGGV